MNLEDSGKRRRKQSITELAEQASGQQVELVDILAIKSEGNPRSKDNAGFSKEAIAGLAESIKDLGLLQPITLRKTGKQYTIIAGERRWRAYKHLKWKQIPAIVLDTEQLDPDKHPLAKIAENLQRADLEPGELARAVAALKEQGQKNKDIAKALGKSDTWVSRKIAHAQILEIHPEAKKIESTTAADIQKAPPGKWAELIHKALNGENARVAIREQTGKKAKKPTPSKKPEPPPESVEQEATEPTAQGPEPEPTYTFNEWQSEFLALLRAAYKLPAKDQKRVKKLLEDRADGWQPGGAKK